MIESQANPHVKLIRSLAADRKDRRRERLFVIEGVRLVADALAGGARLDLALYAPAQLELTRAGQALLDQLETLAVAHPASAQVVAAASDTVHPQGVVVVARWPQIEPGVPGIMLVLDAIQDPGNMGALLRSAEAVGVAEVLGTIGTVDVYSPKVVRAAMGAHMHLALTQDLSWDAIAERLALVDQVYAADAAAKMPYFAADWRQPSALIIGNEAHGLSEDARALARCPVGIPMHGRAESLNAAVAGSVILFEALRQRTRGRS
jgi:TrmH family RNA methyltransferase